MFGFSKIIFSNNHSYSRIINPILLKPKIKIIGKCSHLVTILKSCLKHSPKHSEYLDRDYYYQCKEVDDFIRKNNEMSNIKIYISTLEDTVNYIHVVNGTNKYYVLESK